MAASLRDVNISGVLLKVCLFPLRTPIFFNFLFFLTVENEAHCDFKKLRSLLIRTHMLDLISTSEELHYENYRQAQMETRKFGEPKVKKLDNPKFKEEEEQLRKKFTEQVKAEEARFRQWEQHVRFFRIDGRCVLTLLSFLPVDCGAGPFEQGSGAGSQCHQAARGGVGESPGWVRQRYWQTMNAVGSAFMTIFNIVVVDTYLSGFGPPKSLLDVGGRFLFLALGSDFRFLIV